MKKEDMKLPPLDKCRVMSGYELSKALEGLIGRSFPLTDKPRTNGSSLRKMIAEVLAEAPMEVAADGNYKIMPYRKKGVPRLLAFLMDSYIVTTGDSYNLQVWNRFPNSRNMLVRYANGERIICKDIRIVLVKVDVQTRKIESVVVTTPAYIESRFGKFGVPTLKYQLIISSAERSKIVGSESKMVFHPDTEAMKAFTSASLRKPSELLSTPAMAGKVYTLDAIKERVAGLIGKQLPATDTKTRGQLLEREVALMLGYANGDALVGGYPDIPNQWLEVKVQDSPTVDLGKYSPSNAEVIDEEHGITTEDVRYLIALTNKTSGVIEGIVLAPGVHLGDSFTFVNGTSFKCQRSIPMSFFEENKGKSVFNPKVQKLQSPAD